MRHLSKRELEKIGALWVPKLPALIRPKAIGVTFQPIIGYGSAPMMEVNFGSAGSLDNGSGAATLQVTGLTFGAASSNREIFAIIGISFSSSISGISSVSIGGVAATQRAIAGEGSRAISAIYSAVVTTGTTGTVSVTGSSDFYCIGVSSYIVLNRTGGTMTPATSTSQSPTLTLTLPSNGAILAGGMCADGSAGTWTNAIEDADIDTRTNEWFTSARGTASNPTLTRSSGSFNAACGIAFD